MSTKQLRLSDAAQIKAQLGNFLGKKINIVMLDSTVVFGVLKAVTASEVTVVNMRIKQATYPIANITEIYFDTNS